MRMHCLRSAALACAVLLACVLAGPATASAVQATALPQDIPGTPLPPSPVSGCLDASAIPVDGSVYDAVFSIALPEGSRLDAFLYALQSTDFDLWLFPPGCPTIWSNTVSEVASSCTQDYPEYLSYDVPTGKGGTYYVDVSAYQGTGDYSLAYAVTPPFPASRLAGATRYDTSIAISQATFATGACDSVIVATGRTYPDALGANALAGAAGCPVLLVDGLATTLSAKAGAEIARLTSGVPTFTVYIMGGKGAVYPAVEGAIRARFPSASVRRVAGVTRYETAIECAKTVRAITGAPVGSAFVVTGRDFRDALLAGPVAFAHRRPVFLTDNSPAVNARIAAAAASVGATSCQVIGSTANVTAATIAALAAPGRTVSRVASATSVYRQSVDVANWAVSKGLLGWDRIGVASGEQFPDALGAGARLGRDRAPLLLTHTAYLDTPVRDAIRAHKGVITHVTYFGGTGAVSGAVQDRINLDLR